MKNKIESVFFSFELGKEEVLKEPIYEGNLTIDKANGMKLVFCKNNIPLYDKFNDKNLCIYGQTVSGKKFTIDKSFMTIVGGGARASKGLVLSCQTISISRIFIGDWISEVDNLKIDNLLVRFSYFEHWFKWMEVKETNTKEGNIDNFTIPVTQFKSDFNAIINEKLNIELSYSWQTKIKGNRIFTLNSERFLKLNFPQTVEINSALDEVFILNSLFQILLTKGEIFVENLHFYRDEEKIVVYQTQPNYVPEKDNISCINFLDEFHEKKSEELFIKWFNLYENYGRIFGLIIANVTYQPNSYIENSFLSKVQWIEGFCRIKYPTTEAQRAKHRGKLAEIKKNLKDGDLEYFNKITGYPYETSLILQLKRVLKDYNILSIVGEDEGKLIEFIETVKRNRDNLTHGKNKEHHIVKLAYQNILLKHLIRIILIQELELSTDSHAYLVHTGNIKFCYNKYHIEND